MKKIVLLIWTMTYTIHLHTQTQLDVQGSTISSDTVAKITSNYSGAANVVGLSVVSQSSENRGTGGHFHGGTTGLVGSSTTGTGIFGRSIEGTAITGASTHAAIEGLNFDTLGGFHIFNQSGGVVGFSTSNPGVYGESAKNVGVRGVSKQAPAIIGNAGEGGLTTTGHHAGVIGVSFSDPVGVSILQRVGVYGLSDSIGVLGTARKQEGIGVYGRTNVLQGRSVKGVAWGENSIGVIGIASAANSTGVWGDGTTGAFFRGSAGTAIQLGGATSIYSTTPGDDDAVIRSQKNQNHGDLFLVTNDEMAIHLDDDNNSEGHFKVFNGDADQLLNLDESGNLTITGTCTCADFEIESVNITSADTEGTPHRPNPTKSTGTYLRDISSSLPKYLDTNSVAIQELQDEIAILKQENIQIKSQLKELIQQLEK